MKRCEAQNIDDKIETLSPQALDEILTRFYAEMRKRDGSEYEPDSLQVMQASIDTADRLAQLVEHRTAVQEVTGSNLGRTNTQGLY